MARDSSLCSGSVASSPRIATRLPPRQRTRRPWPCRISDVYDLAGRALGKVHIEANPRRFAVDPLCVLPGRLLLPHVRVGCMDAKQNGRRKAFEAAEQNFDAIVKAAPRFDLLEETYFYQGLTQFDLADIAPAGKAAEHYRAAAVALDALLKNYPQGKFVALALFRRGDCAFHTDQTADAARFYSQSLTKSPDEKIEPTIMYSLGMVQERLKQWEEAGKTYDAFLKKYMNDPYASEVIMHRGETLLKQGYYQPAADWLLPRGSMAAESGRLRHDAAGSGVGETRQKRGCRQSSGRDLHEVPQIDAISNRAEDGPRPGARTDPRQPSGRGDRPGRKAPASRPRTRKRSLATSWIKVGCGRPRLTTRRRPPDSIGFYADDMTLSKEFRGAAGFISSRL